MCEQEGYAKRETGKLNPPGPHGSLLKADCLYAEKVIRFAI